MIGGHHYRRLVLRRRRGQPVEPEEHARDRHQEDGEIQQQRHRFSENSLLKQLSTPRGGARSGYTTIWAECCQARPLMGQGGAAQDARKEGRVKGQTRVWTGDSACPPCRRVMPQTPSLTDFRRIVVKVGSSLLVDHAAGGLKRAWLDALAADIAELHQD